MKCFCTIGSNEIVVLVVEEQPDEVMVGGKLARRDGGKPGAVMPREGINWAANCWLDILVGPASPLLLKFTSEIATSSVTTGFPNQRRDSKCI